MSDVPGAPVELRGVSHAYGETPVIADVTFDIAGGESLALLGPSGCGKTTLLRVIAGLERPLAGTVSIGGDVVAGPDIWTPPERRRVGMVFQDWALFPHLDVAGNVGYGLPRAERTGTAIEQALLRVGLGGLGERMPSTLSGGQQQRVALARALAPRPRVLLLDEPFSNLDSGLRTDLRTEVHRLLHELEITAVFVTHDQDEAFVLGDRVALMRQGAVVQVGSSRDLYTRPADREVAEFVGSGTILRTNVVDGIAQAPIGPVPVHATNGPADVLLRPEQLQLDRGGDARVDLVEYYGHDAMVFVRAGDALVRVRCGPDVDFERGDAVRVSFIADEAISFPVA